ncbi:Fc.00g082460.m01.CDS01 [Cosmosporella sp. VM-42]
MATKLNIANNTIEENAKAAGFEVAEVESSAFGMLDAVGKFVTVVAVAMSVVDVVLQIIDIVDLLKQTTQLLDQLNGSIRDNYKTYFNSIKDAAKKYNAAIA